MTQKQWTPPIDLWMNAINKHIVPELAKQPKPEKKKESA